MYRGTHRDNPDERPRRAPRALRRVALIVGSLAFLLVVTAMLFLPPASPRRVAAGVAESGDQSFYALPASSSPAAPGTLVRSERLLSAPAGASAWRVLYHTTDVGGADRIVSGLVVAPDSTAERPRVVVGWGHPTTGAVARCAPSNGIDPFVLVEGVLALLRAGYVVVAPDYPGLGVAGPSSYLIGTSESHSLLDAVRVASQLPTGAGPDTLLWGHSQGGHAVLFAGQDATTYTPDLHVRAAAVAAPAADLTQLLDADIGDISGVTIASYAFQAYASAYAPRFPGLSLTSILTDAGAAATPSMAGLCLLGQNLQLHTLARPLVGAYLHSNPAATPPWNALLQENTPGARPIGIPVFVAQGDQDTLVVPSATQTFVAGACARGDAVTFRLYPGATHGTIANSAVPDVVSFFSQVLAGPRPATTC